MLNGDISRMMDSNEMQKAINYLNYSLNRSTQLTPTEIEKHPQLEETWIRRVRENNNTVKEIQEESGVFNYKLGDILLICLDKNNTKNKFDKKRRNFELLGSFLDYIYGNVAANLLNKSFEDIREIVVPIYLTKFGARNIGGIPDNVFKVFGYKKPSYSIESDEEDRVFY
jgi:hypothetical protein